MKAKNNMICANNGTLEISKLLNKHLLFWQNADVDEPLVQKFYFPGFKPRPFPLSGGRTLVNPERILPEQIDVPRLLGLDKARVTPNYGCKVNWSGPAFPEAWMESLIGCPIYASAFSCTAKPITHDIEQFISNFQISDALKSPWLKVMDEVVKMAVDASGDQIGVRQLHMRGIIDMLAACFGEESLCLGLFDHSKQLQQVAERFTQLYIEVALREMALRPRWNGGYVSTWGLFAPGTLLDYQVDASNMIRADLYEELFLSQDASIISNFEYSLVHVHSCGLHIIDALLKIRRLNAIEISLDREAGIWDPSKIVEYCKRIQSSKKSVLIHGQLSQSELNELLASLSPVGLAIFYWEQCLAV